MLDATSAGTLRVYWQPGCTGCLRTKEFLNAHGVDFASVNVLTEEGYAEFERLAARQLPVVARGDTWVNGLDLAGVARLAGIRYGRSAQLLPDELASRVAKLLTTARTLLAQIPERKLDDMLPARPRSYRQLGRHIFEIVVIFLEHIENGRPVTWVDYNDGLASDIASTEDLLAYGEGVGTRFERWWQRDRAGDFTREMVLYYGRRSLHDFLERTTWHAMQHTRQLQLVVETLGMTPRDTVGEADLAGLPLPMHVWDDQMKFATGAAPSPA